MRRWAGAGLATLLVTGAVAGGVIISGNGGSEPPGACEYPTCFPDATNTGVPAGTTLTPDSGDLVVTTNGATVDAMDVEGCIDVRATGVTVQNSRASCITTDQNAAAHNPANSPLTVQDSEVDCGGDPGEHGIFYQNIEAYRVDIQNCDNGLSIDTDMILEDSYIHDLNQCVVDEGQNFETACDEPPSDAHTDGIQGGNWSNSTIRHNTIYAHTTGVHQDDGLSGTANGTSALNINASDSGPTTTDLLVTENLLAGGAFTLYCPGTTPSNVVITNNHFSTVHADTIGGFGPLYDTCTSPGVTTWTGNVYHDGSNEGDPITP